jgi:gliding motility-associated-like protein
MMYNWNFGDGIFSYAPDPIHTYNIAGSYQVSVLVTTPDGCLVESNGNCVVNVFDSPVAEIIANPMITTLGNPTVNFHSSVSSEDVTSQWDFGNNEFTIGNDIEYTYTDTGTYYVTLSVVNEYGCADQHGVYIIVQPVYDLIIPNVFTPDPENEGNGYYDPTALNNNIFFPFTEYVDEFELYIFNRWGEIVFVSNDINYGWNGYYRGQLCQQDVYTYKVIVKHTDGATQSKIGDITLLR